MEDLGNNSGANEQDRISTLPDELIHRILSFGVELNVVVQTSVLSKRWVNLWSTFPFLNFTPLRSILASDAKYLNFITKFLLGRSQRVETCSVHIDLNGINKSVGGMVLLILFLTVSHGVEKLHISSAKLNSQLSFPVLKELSLDQCYVSLTNWSLPCLTTLELETVFPHSDEIKGFQGLKKLSLVDCFRLVNRRNPEFVRIDLPNLETLTILEVSLIRFVGCKLVIAAPTLKFFSFFGDYLPVVSAEGGFPCLEQVWLSIDLQKGKRVHNNMYLNVDYSREMDENQVVNEIMLKISSLFRELRETKVLTLSPETFKVLSRVPNLSKYQPSPFVNLNKLYLMDIVHPSSYTNHVIEYFLSTSPGAQIIA